MSEKNWLSEEDQEKLRSAHKILKEFSEHEIPVIRFNCRKAKNELWQALFELDLIREESSFCR
jgi:prephenate dehydratase